GGGGGGGGGGMSRSGGPGGGSETPVYVVPWKKPAPPPAGGLVLYWFPASQREWEASPLRSSRTLYTYSSQCVAMQVADAQLPNAEKFLGDSKLPVAVLAKPDGSMISKVDSTNGKLKISEVEKAVDSEVKQRESAVTEQINEAGRKVKAGDNEGAIKLYKAVLEQKCMFPKKAKDAANQLKRLGVADIASVPPAMV